MWVYVRMCVRVHVLYMCVILTAGGKKRGFAFVQFNNVFSAGRAVEALNGSEIKGTSVLVICCYRNSLSSPVHGSQTSNLSLT